MRSVWPANSTATHNPRTSDHRTEGSRIARASEAQPFGERAHRPSTERRRARSTNATTVAATNARAGHASGHMTLHAIVVRAHESAWTLLRLGRPRRRGHGRGDRAGILFALGVFLKPLEDSMRWSRSAISMTALINWMA